MKLLLTLIVAVWSVAAQMQNTNLAFQVGFSVQITKACYRHCVGDRDPACERACTEVKGKTVTIPSLTACVTNEMTQHLKKQMDAHSDCTKMRHPCMVLATKKVLARDIGDRAYKCAMATIMFRL